MELKCGRQLENEIVVVSHMSFVCINAWILPFGRVKVTSNKLLVLRERRERNGCRVFRAQAVRGLSSGCLPCILCRRENYTFAAHVECNTANSSFGMATITLWVSSVVCTAGNGGLFSIAVFDGALGRAYSCRVSRSSCGLWRGFSYMQE